MDRLDLDNISTQAAEKSATTLTLSPVTYVLILHLLSMLDANQWFFLDAGEPERDATDAAIDELFP